MSEHFYQNARSTQSSMVNNVSNIKIKQTDRADSSQLVCSESQLSQSERLNSL